MQQCLSVPTSKANSEDENIKLYMKLNKKKEETVETLKSKLCEDESSEGVMSLSIKDTCHLLCGVKHSIMDTLDNPQPSNSSKVVINPSGTSLLKLTDDILDQVELNREKAKFMSESDV